MPIALTNRPELASRRALVQAAEIGIRREKSRPLLPLVMLNGFQSAGMLIQGGIFGLGPNSSLNQWTGRDDVSIQLMWQLEGFGVGNLARIKKQRGNESQAIIELRKTQDMVAADVTRAQARVQSAAARVLQADRALRTGIITFNGHLEGLEQTRRLENVLVLTYRPQEAVYSLELLECGVQRVLHHGRRVQPGTVRAVPRVGLSRPRDRTATSPRRGCFRWTRRGPPSCPRWALGRPGQPDDGRLSLVSSFAHGLKVVSSQNAVEPSLTISNLPSLVLGMNPCIGTRQWHYWHGAVTDSP